MVAITKKKDDGRKVDGAICPGCDHHYQFPSVATKDPDDYGRELREVRGWCFKCDLGYIVLQFKSEGKWLTYEYRKYIYGKDSGPKPVPVGPWVKGYPLPETDALIVGPGGDFTKKVDINAEIEKTLQAAVTILGKAAKNLVELLDITIDKSEAKND